MKSKKCVSIFKTSQVRKIHPSRLSRTDDEKSWLFKQTCVSKVLMFEIIAFLKGEVRAHKLVYLNRFGNLLVNLLGLGYKWRSGGYLFF